MSGFYVTKYLGSLGGGEGAFYVGHGIVVGTDALGGIYEGSYREENGVLTGTARLAVRDGGLLATGRQVRADESVAVRFTIPMDFANGQPHQINVADEAIGVVFRKVRELP